MKPHHPPIQRRPSLARKLPPPVMPPQLTPREGIREKKIYIILAHGHDRQPYTLAYVKKYFAQHGSQPLALLRINKNKTKTNCTMTLVSEKPTLREVLLANSEIDEKQYPLIQLVENSGLLDPTLLADMRKQNHLMEMNVLAAYLTECGITLTHHQEIEFFFEEQSVSRTLKILEAFLPRQTQLIDLPKKAEKIDRDIWQILLCCSLIGDAHPEITPAHANQIQNQLMEVIRECLFELRPDSSLNRAIKKEHIEKWLGNLCDANALSSIIIILDQLRKQRPPSNDDIKFLLNHNCLSTLHVIVTHLCLRNSFNLVNWTYLVHATDPDIQLLANQFNRMLNEPGTQGQIILSDLLSQTTSPMRISQKELKNSRSFYAANLLIFSATKQNSRLLRQNSSQQASFKRMPSTRSSSHASLVIDEELPPPKSDSRITTPTRFKPTLFKPTKPSTPQIEFQLPTHMRHLPLQLGKN